MESFYIKQQTKYCNGEKAPWHYAKLDVTGKTVVISTARNTVSQPSTFQVVKGFIVITKEEFESVLKTVYAM